MYKSLLLYFQIIKIQKYNITINVFYHTMQRLYKNNHVYLSRKKHIYPVLSFFGHLTYNFTSANVLVTMKRKATNGKDDLFETMVANICGIH
jgi:hypothetical protein